MGTASRHAGAPYADGETLAGADLETDIANIYSEVNGNLDNTNIKSAAAIDGSKIADTSITGTKLVGDTVTKAKVYNDAQTQCSVSIATQTTAALATATTYADVPFVTAATITPYATGDFIEVDWTGTLVGTGAVGSGWYFTFSVDGTDQDALARVSVFDWDGGNSAVVPVTMTWAGTATATTAHVIKPRYKASGTTVDGTWAGSVSAVLRTRIIPQK